MQWTSRFSEVVIVASCDEYLSLELACLESTHLTSVVCKVSATDCPVVGSGKKRGRQVKPLGANGCLEAKRPDALARLSDHQLGWLTVPSPQTK